MMPQCFFAMAASTYLLTKRPDRTAERNIT